MSFQRGDHRFDFEVSCPFNINHRMPMKRLLYHISNGCQDKTKKAHLYVQCPYNFLHFIRKDLKENHLDTCKTKLRICKHSAFSEQEKGEIDEVIKRQFVDKNLSMAEPIKPRPLTYNKDRMEEGLPSWSKVFQNQYDGEWKHQQLSQQRQDNTSNYEDEEQDEINLIALLNNLEKDDNQFQQYHPQRHQPRGFQYEPSFEQSCIGNDNFGRSVEFKEELFFKSNIPHVLYSQGNKYESAEISQPINQSMSIQELRDQGYLDRSQKQPSNRPKHYNNSRRANRNERPPKETNDYADYIDEKFDVQPSLIYQEYDTPETYQDDDSDYQNMSRSRYQENSYNSYNSGGSTNAYYTKDNNYNNYDKETYNYVQKGGSRGSAGYRGSRGSRGTYKSYNNHNNYSSVSSYVVVDRYVPTHRNQDQGRYRESQTYNNNYRNEVTGPDQGGYQNKINTYPEYDNKKNDLKAENPQPYTRETGTTDKGKSSSKYEEFKTHYQNKNNKVVEEDLKPLRGYKGRK